MMQVFEDDISFNFLPMAHSAERILGFYPKDGLDQQAKRISQNLRAIVCQRLIRQLCPLHPK